MENTLTDRLKELASQLKLSQSQFADALSVQRSTISHLFSGRNKPSISLIVKISETFPELSIPWLLHGSGSIFIENASKSDDGKESVTGVNNTGRYPTIKDGSTTEFTDESKGREVSHSALGLQAKSAPKLTKIALIYDDGSVQLIDAN